ncbi:UNVERIFIED_ORG: sodium-dependent dicarboxylate transporter 2/3/5 [Idiomarina abyssalis]|uniref:Na+/dicarboxylate symporter n=1 Tax=Idiomarina loihiensis (strain ATCC BAA-735 / DSM 15497 / L2-TR) TaxID=283942 RepID=Q5QYJ1_IDILO|nr:MULTISPECIES: SLC13 family permease [Idiomarina]MBL4857413.1 SLC13/DASS family transporter [Idiomarina sp.]AAV83228.1 Na+/dicarboxylate symporter [Idiomarina loihiensis L2TR]AGM37271.1 Na+/dicarboxylate symporter [Idiomarina loihiensis GSL 199]PHQ88826.1 MAG: sodium:dicarboxylate symporter [Idiomarina sp.]TDO46963.1 sodium-dependent dicarboxylate transporter 2/3/5 [Idiomarina sp. 017G]
MKHLALGPITALIVLLTTQLANMPLPAALTLSTVVWVAWWWVTECIPLPVTSLLPFVLLPTFGVIDTQTAAGALGDNIILLFMGAFMLAKAVEASGVHKRMALSLIARIGADNGRKVVISFMAATAFLSMWISNTASVLALLPVALALADASDDENFQRALLLGLAYAGSLGGVATLVGTPPNLIFASIYQNITGVEFSFTRWLGIGLPMVLLGLPIIALWLTRNVKLSKPLELPTTSEMTTYEKRVLMVFGTVVVLWITRTAPFGGWTGLLGVGSLNDATVALAGVVSMFVIPTGNAKNEKLLNWPLARDIPWGILLLFAGGICLARGVMESGLGELIGQSLTALDALPLWLLIFVLSLTVSFVTEVTSNTATATLLMPILAATATALELPIELLMIPAVIACSCAFCMPVATPPNSIVFASNRVTIKDMAKEGLVLNILLAIVTTLVVLIFV